MTPEQRKQIDALIMAGRYFPEKSEITRARKDPAIFYKYPAKADIYNRRCLEAPYWSSPAFGQGYDAASKIIDFVEQAANAREAIEAMLEENKRLREEAE